MYLTKKQFSFTIWIFLIALVFAITEFAFSYYTQIVLKESLYANGVPIFFDIKYIAEILLFWLVVFYLIKDAKASFGAMALQLFIGYSYHLRILLFPDLQFFGITGFQSLDLLVRSLPYLLFGFLHFQNNRWWLFLLFHVAVTGFYLSDLSQQTSLIIKYTDYDFQRLVMISDGAGLGYDGFIWPAVFTTNFLMVWKYILFFCCYNLVRIGFRKKEIQLIDIVNQGYDSLNFTIIFWVSRWTLFLMPFALVDRYYSGDAFYLVDSYIFSTICLVITVFAFVSIHRNMVTSYLLSKGLKVGWNYVFLNAPIINFFVWLYIIIKKRVRVNTAEFKENALQGFSKINQNTTLRSFILIINMVVLFLFIIRFRGERFENIFPVIMSLSIGLIAVVMFFINLKAIYIYFGILAIFLLLSSLIAVPLLSIALISAMITLMQWVPVFYLDKMNLVSAKRIEE